MSDHRDTKGAMISDVVGSDSPVDDTEHSHSATGGTMQNDMSASDNPLRDLIDDGTFEELSRHKLFSEKALRDYQIRRLFKTMRNEMSAGDAIDKIREMYPYLQFDTVRKIVYQISK
jgi:hypothetical protein